MTVKTEGVFLQVRPSQIEQPACIHRDSKPTDFLWYVEHPEAFEAYRGKHVAIWGKQVTGYGDSAKEAYEMAGRNHPKSKPTLTFTPREEELIL